MWATKPGSPDWSPSCLTAAVALFRRRRRVGLEFDLLAGAEVQRPPRPAPPAVTPGPNQWIAPLSGDGWPFHVSGTSHRQDALAKVGSGKRLFRLIRQPDNPHDPYAVQVVCEGVHIGFVSAKNSRSYSDAIAKIEANGREVFVQGQVRKQGNQYSTRWVALIDCCYPNEF